MAKISTYPSDSNLNADDLLIGTDSEDSNATKNYSISSIEAYVKSNLNLGVTQVITGSEFSNQTPSGLDTPLQVEFGIEQGTGSDPVQLSSAGAITFNQAGLYLFNGYGNFEPELPPLPGTGGVSGARDPIDQAMCGMGFVEVKNYILTDGKVLEAFGKSKGMMEIGNSRTVEFNVIRTCLAPGLLANFATNKTKGLPQKFYEVGVAYEGEEKEKVCFAEIGVSVGLSTIQSSLQTLLKEMKVPHLLKEGKDDMFIEGRCFVVESEGKKIGVLGEIHPKVLDRYGLEYPVALCELETKYLQ